MTAPPEDLNLIDLIRYKKGDAHRGGLRYEDLAQRRPIDPDTGKPLGPGADRLEQIINYGLKAFPDPKSIKGLAVMLQVSEVTILDACARSLDIAVDRHRSRLEILLPPGHERLPDDVVQAFLTMLSTQIAALPDEQPPAKTTARRRR